MCDVTPCLKATSTRVKKYNRPGSTEQFFVAFFSVSCGSSILSLELASRQNILFKGPFWKFPGLD